MNKSKMDWSIICEHPAFIPVVILLFCLGGFALMIPVLGYYGDDLVFAWLAYKSHEIQIAYVANRPLTAYYYSFLAQFIGPAPWHWQVIELFFRWLCAVAFWRLLIMIWPKEKAAAVTAAVLFALYPGFWANSEALTMHTYYIQLALFLGSLSITLKAMRDPKRFYFWTALALLGSFLNLLISEYFYTLELVRLGVIWLELNKNALDWKRRLVRAFWQDLPYLAILTGIIGLRFVGVGNYTATYPMKLLEDFRLNPFTAFQELLPRILADLWKYSFSSLGQALILPGLEARSPRIALLFLAAILAAGVLWFWVARGQDRQAQEAGSVGASFSAAGLLSMLVAGWPIWVPLLESVGDANTSRFSLPFMLGACLLVTGEIKRIPIPWVRNTIYSVLIAGSMAFQILIGFQFSQQAEIQKDFLWQVALRMPVLKPGTLLITNADPIENNSDNSNAAMINWLYTPTNAKLELNYYVLQGERKIQEVLSGSVAPANVEEAHRIGNFTRRSLVTIYYHYPNCLRVLDPELDQVNPAFTGSYLASIRLSEPSAIQPAANPAQIPHPPVEIYGDQAVPDNWCSNFQKANLAAQAHQWSQVVEIGDRLMVEGFLPNTAEELLVYIEGYAQKGDWQRVSRLLGQALEMNPDITPMLCALKNRLVANIPASPEQARALAVPACVQAAPYWNK